MDVLLQPEDVLPCNPRTVLDMTGESDLRYASQMCESYGEKPIYESFLARNTSGTA